MSQNSSKNLYEVLGVSKEASAQEIKKAYRALSLELHPDRNHDPGAQSKFQEMSSAYEILGDSEKKMQYDNEQSGMFSNMSNMSDAGDIGNLFNMLFGMGGGMHGGMPGMPPGMQMHMGQGGMHFGMPPGMAQGMAQGGPNIRIYHNGQMFHPPQQKPQPIQKNIQITIEQCYTGCSVPIEIERWIFNGDVKCSELETIYLTVPPGIDENECIMITGKGNALNDELKGDIKVGVQVINNSTFIRQGMDLYYKKTVSLKDALCGFSFEIQHLNGKTFCLNNNTNHTIIKPNFKKTIPNLGMNRENTSGNLIIDFDVQFPDSLTPEQIEGLKTNL